jgi:hypothetical protein
MSLEASDTLHPSARDDLDVNEVPDGLVVYDEITGQVHHLNWIATAVFALCDGHLAVTDIARELQSLYGLPAPPMSETVEAIEMLQSRGLLD